VTSVRVGFTGLLLPLLIAACGSGEDLTQPNGAVEMTTTTVNGSGAATYQVTLQGRAGAALAPVSLAENDTAVVSDLAVGEVDVTLAGVATGCAMEGTNPRTVTVVEGVQALVAFRIVCSVDTPTGSLEVGVTSTGDPPDGTGYTVLLDPGISEPLGTSDTVTIASLAAGDHAVRLADVADNCTVQGDNPQPVTIAAGDTAHAAFEVVCRGPLAGRIVYVSDRNGGDYDLLLQNADGTGLVDLTNTPEERDREPAWSPDGTTLCFHQDDDNTSDVIYLLDLATGQPTPLHTGFPGARSCRWSPDGTRILFWSLGTIFSQEHLVVMGADGANPRSIADFDSFDGYSWSPDGRQVAFVGSSFSDPNDDFPHLFVVNANGTNRVALTGVDRGVSGADWSPDGRRIAFVAGAPDHTGQEIYLIDPVTREEVALTRNPSTSYISTAWSPDGSTLAFVRDRSQNFDSPIRDIYTIRADGTGFRNLTNAPNFYFELSWAPDGQHLVFTYGVFAVGIINSDGSGRRTLSANDASNFEAAWAP
jgi:Tol biopolymer transport system component